MLRTNRVICKTNLLYIRSYQGQVKHLLASPSKLKQDGIFSFIFGDQGVQRLWVNTVITTVCLNKFINVTKPGCLHPMKAANTAALVARFATFICHWSHFHKVSQDIQTFHHLYAKYPHGSCHISNISYGWHAWHLCVLIKYSGYYTCTYQSLEWFYLQGCGSGMNVQLAAYYCFQRPRCLLLAS